MKEQKKITNNRELYEYYKKAPRGKFELWLNLHNHKLEFIRTIGNVLSGIGGLLAILRIFNII